MALHVVRRVAELGDSLVLAPERFDPRRRVEVISNRFLCDFVEVVTENLSARLLSAHSTALILDTTHAYEGVVVLRHDPVSPKDIGSAKRWLKPGDVIISRLRPYLRQVAYVDEALFKLRPSGNAVVASTEFFIARGRSGFDPAGLVPFLLSEPVQSALAAGQEGGHHPRFAKELLLSLPVPDCVAREMSKTADRVREIATAVRNSLLICRSLVAKVEADMSADSSLASSN